MRAATIEGFPGLDLRTDPADSKGAIDMLNVVLEPGRVKTRPGSTILYETAALPVFAMANQRGPTTHLIVAEVGTPGALHALNSAGVLLASTTLAAVDASGATGVAIGTATNDYFYVTAPGGVTVVKRWDGAAWTSPAGFPAATQVLGHSQTDNRLIACVGSRANFSDPGAPETFGANNYVSLGVGDGEQIHGYAWFNNQAFIFKKTKFFVFYGTSADGTGEPVFNYRPVDTGVGMWAYAPQAVCVGPDGVYFLASDGIYRTTGGPPVKISAALDPFFAGATGPFWTSGNWSSTDMAQRLHWHDGKLYAALATPGGRLLLVWDSSLNAWTAWSHTARALASLPATAAAPGLIFGAGALLRSSPAVTTDVGEAIVSRYRSAFNDFGSPLQKMIRETIVEGTGSPTLQWSRDWRALTTGGAVTLGVAPAVSTGRQSKALPGRTFSFQLGASSGAWAVHQVQPNVLESSRPVSITT